MTIDDIAHGTARVALPAGRYRLHPVHSSVAFTAKKLGLFTVRGTMGIASGEFTIGTPLERSRVHVVVPAVTFSTPMTKRDAHVKGPALLDVAAYPHMEFTSTEVVLVAGVWEIRGLLSVHGQTAPAVLVVTATARQDGGLVRISATTEVQRRQFGVTAMRAVVSSVIAVQIEAVGIPVQ
jgi:polyisoprenoid-binding protein YceI